MLTNNNEQFKSSNAIHWWHSIDLGNGSVTPGTDSLQNLQRSFTNLRLPALTGQSVLDIGANDGFFSFEAERQGAGRVVAMDYFYWHSFTGGTIGHTNHEPKSPSDLPGKRGFDFAHHKLSSRVESIVDDFMTTDLDRLGSFDVVLFLGVLYHLQHPLLALQRLARVTKKLAVIETHAIDVPGFRDHAICEFYETSQLNNDATNWWGPNVKALVDLCRTAGFRKVDVIRGAPVGGRLGLPLPRLGRGKVRHYRALVHAWK